MIFQPLKPIALIILTLLVMLTACTPPNYAPVKTVNQAFEPNNGYISKKSPINSGHNPAQQQESGKTMPQGLQNQPNQQNPVVTKIPYPYTTQNKPYPSHSIGKSVKKQASLSPNTVISSRNPEFRTPTPLPYKINPKIENNNKNHIVDKNTEPTQDNTPTTDEQITKQSINKSNISNTNTIALRSAQHQNTQTTDKQPSSQKNIKEKKSIISIDNKKMLKLNFGWPIRGKIFRNFSQTDSKGIDIKGNIGQAVHAAEAGKAVYCGQGLAGYGNLVIIKHNENYLSAYANNSQLNIKEGQQVDKGQTIGQIGHAGLKKASLHFEIRKNGKSINPLTLLPKH